jgi:protein-S-isoprenylcysteine O-methyltransferase Ste14
MPAALPVIYDLWGLWAVTWLAAGLWSAPTAARAGLGEAVPYRTLQVVGALMLFGPRPAEPGPAAWPVGETARWALAALALAGFGFCWWARLHLGRLWSGTVTRKQGHHIVDTGPYALVRHPIYTGLILAGYATAVARGGLVPLAGASIMVLAWWMKARLEERWLAAELGPEAYAAYAARTPMLAPFLKF